MEHKFKPLGKKSYGHIPHLDGSRMGPADKKCSPGHQTIATESLRDGKDTVILQEKLDGCNVGVVKLEGKIIALTRGGYLAEDSDFIQHKKFAEWVKEDEDCFKDILLSNGQRLCGEWLMYACGTKYKLPHEPFVLFDMFLINNERVSYKELKIRNRGSFTLPYTPHIGGPISIKEALKMLGKKGHHGALERIEGAVWRCEREGKVDFLLKYVRPDKIDGKYMELDLLNEWSK